MGYPIILQKYGGNYTPMNVQTSIAQVIGGVTMTVKTLTLSSASWSSGQYIISDTDITADAVVILTTQAGVTADQYNALAAAQIVGGTQSACSIVLVALGTVPTIDLPITLIIQGVS